MSRINLNIPLEVASIEKLVLSMPTNIKIKLMQKLEQDTWAERFDKEVGCIRKGLKKIDDNEIDRIIEETRQRIFNERTPKKVKSCNRY